MTEQKGLNVRDWVGSLLLRRIALLQNRLLLHRADVRRGVLLLCGRSAHSSAQVDIDRREGGVPDTGHPYRTALVMSNDAQGQKRHEITGN